MRIVFPNAAVMAVRPIPKRECAILRPVDVGTVVLMIRYDGENFESRKAMVFGMANYTKREAQHAVQHARTAPTALALVDRSAAVAMAFPALRDQPRAADTELPITPAAKPTPPGTEIQRSFVAVSFSARRS